jgi:PIN domain nuclease of toxin-antitoxin system
MSRWMILRNICNEVYFRHSQKLPFIHRDPFDRIIIATAISEEVCLVTADKNIHLYDVDWVW